MDKLNTLISLNEAKHAIDELIVKVKKMESENDDSRKLLIIALSVIGALVVVAVIAYAVYRHFSEDYLDDYEDLDDVFEDEDEDEDEVDSDRNLYEEDFEE